MDNQLKVSIGMPVYNGEKSISQAIDSLLSQDYSNFELIILDNASTDKTKAICQAYSKKDKRIKYFRNKKNIGPVSNFNSVFNLASSKYFMWAADDDFWSSHYIKRCITEFKKFKQAILITMACRFIDPAGKKPDYIDYGIDTFKLSPVQRFKLFRLAINTRRYTNSIIYGIFKKSFLLDSMPFINVLASDHLLIAKVCLMGEIKTIPTVGILRKWGGTSSSFAKTAAVQGITNPFLIKFPLLVREIIMQYLIWKSEKITFFEKIDISFFSIIKYLDKSARSLVNRNITKVKKVFKL